VLSSNSSSDQNGSTVNNKLLAVNIDHYPFEQTYDQNDLNINWNPDTQKYTGFLPVTVKATGVPSYTSFYADVDGQLFQQPIAYDGKYKFVLKNDGPFATGLVPQFMQDQNSNSYDIYIKHPNNKATLKLTDSVINIVRRQGSVYNGKITLPDPVFNILTDFENNDKDYATSIEIDVNDLTLPNLKKGIIINQQGEWNVVNNDGNNDDIEFEKENTPTPQLLIKKAPLLRDGDDPMDDDTETKLGSFIVNIPPPKINSPTTNNGFYKFNNDWNALTEGSSEDHDLIIQVPNSTETLTATQNNHTYTPSQGNVGFSSVTVEVPQPSVESTQTVNITENTTTIVTPSDGYTSIGRLEITTDVPSNVNNQNLTTIRNNGTYTPEAGYSGFNSFTVDVPQPSIQQNKSITLNSNDTFTINPDNNYDALGQITITTEVPTTDTVINNQNVNSNNLITSNGFYAPDNQHTGFNAFTVAVPIQDNKTVNVNGAVGQTFSIFPDTGYEGLKKTTFHVIAPAYQTKTIRNNGTYTPDSGYDAFSSITVDVSSSSTPKQISVLKVGSDGESINTSSFTSVPSNGTFTVTPGDYIDEETDTTKYGFWILSYLIRDNSCWICLANVYRESNSSPVTVTNNSDVTAYYYVYNQRDVYFSDASSIIAYGNGDIFMSQTVGSSFEINTSNQNNIDLYPIDPTNPQNYTPPSFSLDCFTLPGGRQ